MTSYTEKAIETWDKINPYTRCKAEIALDITGKWAWDRFLFYTKESMGYRHPSEIAATLVSTIAQVLADGEAARLITSPGNDQPLVAALLITPDDRFTDWADLVDQVVGAVWS